GRHKSVIMRSGWSARALLIPCTKFSAREVSYPASFRQKARSRDTSELSSTISIFCAIERPFQNDHPAGTPWQKLSAAAIHHCPDDNSNSATRLPLRVLVIFFVGEVNPFFWLQEPIFSLLLTIEIAVGRQRLGIPVDPNEAGDR